MIRTLIIDDEPIARADLRTLLGAHPHVTVVGEARSVATGRALLESAEYELVFLDLQLIGGSGFDLVPHVRPGARVIFATAFDDQALRAFEVNALDYLLKPVKPERLADALKRIPTPAAAKSVEAPLPPRELRVDDIVQLHSGTQARFTTVSDLCAIEAQENYSLVHLADGTRVLVRRSMKAWREMLPASFMRVHRTAIVNLTCVTGYQRNSPKMISLQLRGLDHAVPVGREAWPLLKTRLPDFLA